MEPPYPPKKTPIPKYKKNLSMNIVMFLKSKGNSFKKDRPINEIIYIVRF